MNKSLVFKWRPATQDDAQVMADIYNQTIAGGLCSPQLRQSSQESMRASLQDWWRSGSPVRVFLHDDQVIAWSCIHPIVWGPEVCYGTGDFSLYVDRAWYGSGVAMQSILLAFDEAPRHGFESVSTWILGVNKKSSMLARACRMKSWGVLPKAARHGDQAYDVQIWGGRFDDPQWVHYMNTLRMRIRRRARFNAGIEREEATHAVSVV